MSLIASGNVGTKVSFARSFVLSGELVKVSHLASVLPVLVSTTCFPPISPYNFVLFLHLLLTVVVGFPLQIMQKINVRNSN